MKNKDELIRQISSILSLNEEIGFAYLFGSYATGKETQLSDIDIAIFQKMHKSAYEYRITEFKTESELTAKFPGNKFDVRSMNDAPIIVIGTILNEGILLFNNSGEFHLNYTEENRIKYMDYFQVYNSMLNERYSNLLNGR